MGEVIRRFLIYVTRDVEGRASYPRSAKLCNSSGEAVRAKLRYAGPFTKTGLEGYVEYIALVLSNGASASNAKPEGEPFDLGPGECVDVGVEYVVSKRLKEELDFVKLKLINDGRLNIGGFQFDVVKA
ncbi:MAG: hypothetical protein TU35_006975 [Thermoproteus sp. AZ2]|jgi:folate-dependent tRNA-U54 methylase TrmFO/GidA|uniref:Uncharacterized protein n=1 Tax=Thermoproteus sp. AZ2 TaxID=1609232 RepID=A0ACC6V2L9_9CREN|nr:MAG: hypothetical protein TU35_07290 [Thermoproteus sp. AZ2]